MGNPAAFTEAQLTWIAAALGLDLREGAEPAQQESGGELKQGPGEGGGVPDSKLADLARWPEQAHTAWKKLTGQQKVAVLFAMASRYGEQFAKQFETFNKSGARNDGIDYGPGFPEHTKEWFEKRGYKLAMKDSVHEWWVHPNGHEIMAAIDRPPEEPPAEEEDPAELLRMTLETIRQDIEENKTRQDEATAKKNEIGALDVTSDQFAEGYAKHVKMLDGGKKRVEEQLKDIDDAIESLKQMRADLTKVEQGRSEVQEQQNWFDVERDMVDMLGRKPIRVTPKGP